MSWRTVEKRVSDLERRRGRWPHVFILNWVRDPDGAAVALAKYRDARARGVTGIVFIQFGSPGAKFRAARA